MIQGTPTSTVVSNSLRPQGLRERFREKHERETEKVRDTALDGNARTDWVIPPISQRSLYLRPKSGIAMLRLLLSTSRLRFRLLLLLSLPLRVPRTVAL